MGSSFMRFVSRRDLLTVGVAAAAFCLSGCNLLSPSGDSEKIPIGLQLYSVRGECEKDLPGVLNAVAEMGYDGVEFAGYYGRSAEELRNLLDENGLVCCGTHTQLDTLLGDNLESTIEFNKTLGNKFLIVPGLPEERRNSPEAWKETAELFNDLAAKVKPHGMRVGYHNHAVEFEEMGGQIPWDIFFGTTDPEVVMQFDTGNAMHGGGDPVTYIERYPGRATTVHVKEYSQSNPKALVGDGDLDWEAVFASLEKAGGTEWYIVEYESDLYPPLESVKRCLENLRRMGK